MLGRVAARVEVDVSVEGLSEASSGSCCAFAGRTMLGMGLIGLVEGRKGAADGDVQLEGDATAIELSLMAGEMLLSSASCRAVDSLGDRSLDVVFADAAASDKTPKRGCGRGFYGRGPKGLCGPASQTAAIFTSASPPTLPSRDLQRCRLHLRNQLDATQTWGLEQACEPWIDMNC